MSRNTYTVLLDDGCYYSILPNGYVCPLRKGARVLARTDDIARHVRRKTACLCRETRAAVRAAVEEGG